MTQDADALIVGGGLNGPAAALALAQAGLRVALIDAAEPDERMRPDFDGRAYNLGLASRRFLQVAGVWEAIAPHVQPVAQVVLEDARPGDRAAAALAHFDHDEIDEGPAAQIVEDRVLRPALLQAAMAHPLIALHAPATVLATRRDDVGAEAELSTGEVLRAPVLIACDGRDSRLARAAGILRTGWGYDQTGLVSAVEHERDHGGVARQRFLPGGPFAVLPLPGGRRSSLVWTERTAEAQRIHALPDAEYRAEVEARMGGALGAVTLAGRRWMYPLKLSVAQAWVAPRLALVGDAAHAVHPIAGQGLNLGLRDAAALAEVLAEAKRRGEDIGVLTVLERYQRWRRFDGVSLALGMDAVNRLFSNDDPGLRLIRDAGVRLATALRPARRAFMREAAGVSGDLPRMLRGEAI
ncbi:FAD-dependent monooxygenase [Albimonas sp. CAU 1670]|uniref:FAD-dependent monooxygenase n=1 Tax=Albimonas sp. CAU 1670 TaxID=3032599 RepID=UPI0023DAFB71|nr:FAD-dependent monooxygenase [Albimonas sp. CAU 1670]MDF2231142.1 FAD-dependent monooxygenase [Albimonas sp. CAU 1670]